MGFLSRLFFRPAPTAFTGEPMKVHCVPAYISSLFIVEYPNRRELLLLDCGFPTDFERARFYVESVMKDDAGNPYSLQRDMKLAVISHCHIDHAGASTDYHRLGIPIARASEMESTYQGPRRRFQMFAEAILGTFVATRMRRQMENPFIHSGGLFGPYWSFLTPAVAQLADGQALPCGFDDWSAVKVPGHTTHMVALYHRSSGLFYTADMFVRLRKGFFPPKPVNYNWAYEHSLARIRLLNVQCILMAHGGIVNTEEVGSWKKVLEQVNENHERNKLNSLNPTGSKRAGSRFSNWIGAAALRVFGSGSTETRAFSPEQLQAQTIVAADTSPISNITYDP